MAIESYVDDILQSPESTFRKIISRVIIRRDKDAKIELVRQYTEVDETLFEAIKSILNDLKIEEGRISRFLYRYFKIEIFKNKKREQLILLGSQLKTQYSKLKKEKRRVDMHIDNLLDSLENLRRLKEAFVNKIDTLKLRQERNKSHAYIRKISHRIEELNRYKSALEQKQEKLFETEKLYRNLYYQIPRYYELREEHYLNLLAYKGESK
jgi:hypothetical protein